MSSTNRRPVEALKHDDKRPNIPTAEDRSMMEAEERKDKTVVFDRHSGGLEPEKAVREPDLDPQLVWRGKDKGDPGALTVEAPPLYIQEKIHPQALVLDLIRESKSSKEQEEPNLFSDFNGIPKEADRTEFYTHDQNWTNRMILGDSLQVMASLAEREGLRGKVQCIYLDPPYGIKFNSNFQWSTTSRDVRDGKREHLTREPEQVKAFRDTWRDGIHSYLSYLRDRLTVARELLTESGSVFVQIGDENVHLVRSLVDEVFGAGNVLSQIAFRTTTGRASGTLAAASNYLIWAAKDALHCKYRPLFQEKSSGVSTDQVYSLVRDSSGMSRRLSPAERAGRAVIPETMRIFRPDTLTSSRPAGEGDVRHFEFRGRTFTPGKGTFKTDTEGLRRLDKADRIWPTSQGTVQYVRHLEDFPVIPFSNIWTDTGTGSFTEEKVYVVQTNTKVIERCILMATDPGDLVLDPTCGSGTTAYVAEQWGLRWITIDTSRVALALARARIMGARYPYYLLTDSPDGQKKEAEVMRTAPSSQPTRGDVRHGFVNARVPHITLKSIANNAEIEVIWDKWEATLEPLRAELNSKLGTAYKEWEMLREPGEEWTEAERKLHADWWQARIARQKETDACIVARAEFEFLYDRPYQDNRRVRVAGPFTVESLSPHRMLAVDENGDLVDLVREKPSDYGPRQSFPEMILENLRAAGVQQAHKEDRITFTSLEAWPGDYVCAEGRYLEGETERRAAIFIGPEFGTVNRPDLVDAAREAAEAGFDVLVACAFSYDAHAADLSKRGKLPVLKARMNADLHMAEDLKATGKGNLFVIFGEPDIDVEPLDDGMVRVKVKGVDVFKPQTGEVVSNDPDNIACWFVDTAYNGESFCVRHAYFLGANDPYSALRTTLKAEINEEAWSSLHSDTSRPFPIPATGRIAVKVINHLGDEVMKVYRV